MWKIFDETLDGPRFLFHGVRGLRSCPLDEWIEAEIKWAKEGSNPFYFTAFHCYPSLTAVRAWTRRAHNLDGRVAVEVLTRDVRRKPTRGGAYLARWLQVTRDQWASRIPLAR